MFIILAQKKDFKSAYKDELFNLYHFPAKYINCIHTGDIFVYNQPNQGGPVDANVRYYYGTGTIGNIYSTDGGATYYAELKNCKAFYNNVPLKMENGNYIEQLEYEGRRKHPNWQSSIRELSPTAYSSIINMSGGLMSVSTNMSIEEVRSDLKERIDHLYLNDDHQALVDIISLSAVLVQMYGVRVN